MNPILATLATTPRWHTPAEIAVATGLLPIVVRNRLDALTVARLVEWGDAGRVTLKGGWFVWDRVGRVGTEFHLDSAIALAERLGGVVEREAA